MIRRIITGASEVEQKEAVKAALVDADGNISHAIEATKLSKSHFNRLVDRYELRAFAAELRAKSGALRVRRDGRVIVGLGRPPSR